MRRWEAQSNVTPVITADVAGTPEALAVGEPSFGELAPEPHPASTTIATIADTAQKILLPWITPYQFVLRAGVPTVGLLPCGESVAHVNVALLSA
jgi:hypothetical protein